MGGAFYFGRALGADDFPDSARTRGATVSALRTTHGDDALGEAHAIVDDIGVLV
jgi:hypothetical protein